MTGLPSISFFLSSNGPFTSNAEEDPTNSYRISGSQNGGYEELFTLEYVAGERG
jgi:hypothetical protein